MGIQQAELIHKIISRVLRTSNTFDPAESFKIYTRRRQRESRQFLPHLENRMVRL